MAVISKVSNLNSLFNTIFEAARFQARNATVMLPLVDRYSATGTQDRKFSYRPQATAQEVPEGVDYTGAETWGKTLESTLTVKYVTDQYILTDQQIATDPDVAVAAAANDLGDAVAEKIDSDILELFENFTGGPSSGGIGSAGANLTLSKVAAAHSNLLTNSAPAPHYVVIHPYQWYNIWQELGQPEPTSAFLGDLANEALRMYARSSALGMSWVTSNNISIDSSDDAYGAVFGGRQALAFDLRRPFRIERERDASLGTGAWELNGSVWYGVVNHVTTYGCYLLADATAPDGS
jgi:hypothetical protein